MKAHLALSLLALALLGPGCSDTTDCSSASDCYAMEICQDGSCVIESNNGNNGSNNGSNNNGSNNTPNNGSNNTNNGSNNGGPNNGESNNGNNGSNNTTNNSNNANNGNNGELACIVDQFSVCEDTYELGDRNDTWSDAVRLQSSSGCVIDRNVVVPRSVSGDGILCHLETADWYAQTVVPCDSFTLTATARLHPKSLCLSEDYVFSFRRGSGEMDCTMEDVSCTMEGEDKIIRWLVPPESSVLSFYADVKAADGLYINLEYTISLSVSGP